MTQLSNFLEQEVSKFKDITHILKKLESDGEIDTISKYFRNIFNNEVSFTMKELARIESENKEKLNIKEQCESNLSLFKTNFQAIVNMIFEQAYVSALGGKTTPPQLDDTTVGSINSVSIEETPSSKKSKKSSKSKASDSKSPKRLDLSTPKSKGKKKSNQNSGRKVPSPLSRIFGSSVISMSSTTRNKDVNQSSFMKEKSFHYSQNNISQIQTPKKTSQSILNQSSTLNRSSSFVQSEFNHIHGQAIFARSPRNTDLVNPRECSPGPAAYKAERSSLRQSPSPTIGRAKKGSWIDEQVAMNDSPGVGALYPSHHVLSK